MIAMTMAAAIIIINSISTPELSSDSEGDSLVSTGVSVSTKSQQ